MVKLLSGALAAVSLIALVGCSNEPIDKQYSPNGAVAARIAIIEGCNLYRVGDWERVYVAICPDGRTSTQHQVDCGKGCRRVVQAMTVVKPEERP